MDKGRGPVATVLVQTGTLKVGDIVVVGDTYGRVRALQNSRGERITKAGPSIPAVVLGLGRRSCRGRHPARRPGREDGANDDRGAPRRRHAGARPAAPPWRICTARSRPARPRSCASSSRPMCRARWAPSGTRWSRSRPTRSGSTSCTKARATSRDNDINCSRRRPMRSSSASTPRSIRRHGAPPRLRASTFACTTSSTS